MVFFSLLGIEYMERLRPLNYPKTNVFILCFSLVDHSTFTNIKEKVKQKEKKKNIDLGSECMLSCFPLCTLKFVFITVSLQLYSSLKAKYIINNGVSDPNSDANTVY